MPTSALRLALVVEFLIAILVVFTLWSHLVGPDLLDLIPWHWRLLLGAGVAYSVVRATAAAVGEENAWNARTLGWVLAALSLLLLMGALTYYYRIFEPLPETEETPIRDTLLT
jgi:hypothetical protein